MGFTGSILHHCNFSPLSLTPRLPFRCEPFSGKRTAAGASLSGVKSCDATVGTLLNRNHTEMALKVGRSGTVDALLKI